MSTGDSRELRCGKSAWVLRSLAVFVSIGAALACGSTEPGSTTSASTTHSFALTSEDGIPTARNTGGPKFTGELFRYEKVLELEVDTDNPESILHGARSFTMSADGTFYVADTRRHRIAIFDPAGKYAGSFGREGDGPGDLRNPGSIEIIDELLYVSGSSGQRTTVFDTDGNVVDVLSHNTGRRPSAMYRGPGGERIVITAPFERGTEFQGFSAHIAVYDRSETVVAEVGTENVAHSALATREVDGRELSFISPIHFVATAQALYRSGGDLLVTNGRYPWLRWHGLDGELRRQVHLELEPEPVSEQEREAVAADLERAIAEAPEQSNERERVLGKIELEVRRNNIVFADPKPAWASVQLDDRGYVWARRPHPVLTDYYGNNVFRHRVVDPEGDYLGDTAWPTLLEASIAHGHLLAMVFDEDKLQVAPTVYRIIPLPSGLSY